MYSRTSQWYPKQSGFGHDVRCIGLAATGSRDVPGGCAERVGDAAVAARHYCALHTELGGRVRQVRVLLDVFGRQLHDSLAVRYGDGLV